MPSELHFNKAMSGVKLTATQLRTLLSALESKRITTDLQELRRITVKLFESTFLEATERILNASGNVCDEAELSNSINFTENDAEDDDGIVDVFSTSEGGIFEVRRVRSPKKKARG